MGLHSYVLCDLVGQGVHACMPPYIECSPYIVTVSVLTCIVILAVLLAYFGGAQVVKSTKHAQERKAKTGPRGYADDANTTADAPKRWSDYTSSPPDPAERRQLPVSWQG